MATKAQIERHISDKLRRDLESKKLTGPFVEAAVTEHITASDWTSIAGWIRANNFQQVGKHIAQLVMTDIVSTADARAAEILADDTVSVEEYAEIEGLP